MIVHTETRLHLGPSSILPPDPDERDRTQPEYLAFLCELMDDIRRRPIRRDLLVTKEGDKYRMVAGETMRQAALHVGLDTVPVKVIECVSKGARMLESYLENSVRRDPTLAERANFWLAMMNENNWTQSELAKATGEDKSQINKILTIKGTMNDEELRLLEERRLPFRGMYALAQMFESADARKPFVEKLLAGMTCDVLDDELRKLKKRTKPKPKLLKFKTTGGLIVCIPSDFADAKLTEDLNELIAADRRRQKHALPLSSLSTLLK